MSKLDPYRARFWAKVQKHVGCWEWTAAKDNGYGRFWDGGQMRPAHRVSYELAVGPIPEGMQIDHLCRNPGCVCPDHLEPVTPQENVDRGLHRAGRRRKTVCKNGHKLTLENLRPREGGKVRCRECARQKSLRWYHANKART